MGIQRDERRVDMIETAYHFRSMEVIEVIREVAEVP